MPHHVSFGVRDLTRSGQFNDAALRSGRPRDFAAFVLDPDGRRLEATAG